MRGAWGAAKGLQEKQISKQRVLWEAETSTEHAPVQATPQITNRRCGCQGQDAGDEPRLHRPCAGTGRHGGGVDCPGHAPLGAPTHPPCAQH